MVILPLHEKPALAEPPQMQMLSIVTRLRYVGEKCVILKHRLDHVVKIPGFKHARKVGDGKIGNDACEHGNAYLKHAHVTNGNPRRSAPHKAIRPEAVFGNAN